MHYFGLLLYKIQNIWFLLKRIIYIIIFLLVYEMLKIVTVFNSTNPQQISLSHVYVVGVLISHETQTSSKYLLTITVLAMAFFTTMVFLTSPFSWMGGQT